MTDNLFPLPLPVVVITGEYESGKTLAILTTGYPLERTLVYDNEESATLYEALGPFTRVDLMGELSRASSNGWNNEQFYLSWLKHMRDIEPGTYDVIGIDPIERVEAGLADWVRKNPTYFGHSAGQYSNMSGLFWGDVKDLWGRHILEMRAKAKMVILTAHMRNVYVGGKPTNKRERKGKDTLSEFATLEITLVRKDGQVTPSAKVDKTRLVYGNLSDPSSLRPMFDPWIKEFTWEKVRWYMTHGADPQNLQLEPGPSPEELKEQELHELELRAQIAEAELVKQRQMEAMRTDVNAALQAIQPTEEGVKLFWSWVASLGLVQEDIRAYLTEKFGALSGRDVSKYVNSVWQLVQTEGSPAQG